ncbi:putative effector protein [Ceratobasidium theobromae]|uniref:Putative effector protein n=1 Tax=Ceratobasidium theobromae TaxID=1582974 RepID=A0A5N5QK12_9AGAM|nr:putative effector protein [Ceratobasidium theobromae]
MFTILLKLTGVLPLALSGVFALPSGYEGGNDLATRGLPPPDNIVYVTDVNTFCLMMPRFPYMKIGDSEQPGHTKTYCSVNGRYDRNGQGLLNPMFFSNIEYKYGYGQKGGRYVQLTGCIRPETLSRLNPTDQGGQYDSSGNDGKGMPPGSQCLGYNHYVELVEPAQKRICIRCCDDYDDCPTNKDTQGCPAVIQGNYFDCAY